MATQAKPRRATPARRANTAPAGRFARTATTRTQGLRRRRQPQQSGLQKVMEAVMPAAGKATPGTKKGKAGGFALVAAAAGMAFKNRGKLSQLRHRNAETPPQNTTNGGTIPPAA